ncbi:MAG: ABC transporter permease [Pirellulales bacterium]|nr:ABC transporter permease [Pirellulales bacterium]
MMAFLLRRALWLVLTLWIVFTISFFLMRAVPGGPLDAERQLEPEIRANIEARYHLDEPLARQYLRELANVVRGDLGYSYKMADFSVNEIIGQGFPISASLGIVALSFALVLGLSVGIISAVRRQGWIDVSLRTLATIGIAVPDFVLASVAIILLVFVWPLFPAAGWGEFRHLILPGCCLGAPYAAYIARLTRTGMLDVLNQDYIRTAYAKGLLPRTVIFRHALKGALLPVVSFLGPAIAGILTGSLVVEQIFAIPGLGIHFVQSATQRDYTLAMGLVLLYTALLCLMNLLVDVAYTLLDPRVKLE